MEKLKKLNTTQKAFFQKIGVDIAKSYIDDIIPASQEAFDDNSVLVAARAEELQLSLAEEDTWDDIWSAVSDGYCAVASRHTRSLYKRGKERS